MLKTIAVATALSAATLAVAGADELRPIHNETVNLGTTQGSAYYVVGREGYHLVATLLSGSASTPVRFDAVLTDGQSATVSVPGPVGSAPQAVVFTRHADRLVVEHTSEARSIATQ